MIDETSVTKRQRIDNISPIYDLRILEGVWCHHLKQNTEERADLGRKMMSSGWDTFDGNVVGDITGVRRKVE